MENIHINTKEINTFLLIGELTRADKTEEGYSYYKNIEDARKDLNSLFKAISFNVEVGENIKYTIDKINYEEQIIEIIY